MSHRPRLLFVFFIAALLCAGMAACGQATVSGAIGAPTATTSPATQPPTATVADANATTDPNAPCQPDSYGIYSQQTGYTATIDVDGLPAPPQTKHGIGSTGVSNGVARGGFTGMCTIGTADSINAFYMGQLPALGWTFGTPPAVLTTACTSGGLALWNGQHWWKGQTLFAWDIEGPGGAGSTFWGYSACAMVS